MDTFELGEVGSELLGLGELQPGLVEGAPLGFDGVELLGDAFEQRCELAAAAGGEVFLQEGGERLRTGFGCGLQALEFGAALGLGGVVGGDAELAFDAGEFAAILVELGCLAFLVVGEQGFEAFVGVLAEVGSEVRTGFADVVGEDFDGGRVFEGVGAGGQLLQIGDGVCVFVFQ